MASLCRLSASRYHITVHATNVAPVLRKVSNQRRQTLHQPQVNAITLYYHYYSKLWMGGRWGKWTGEVYAGQMQYEAWEDVGAIASHNPSCFFVI